MSAVQAAALVSIFVSYLIGYLVGRQDERKGRA